MRWQVGAFFILLVTFGDTVKGHAIKGIESVESWDIPNANTYPNVVSMQWMHVKSCTDECVPYYLCKDNEIIEDGGGVIDIRFRAGPECPHYLETCCKARSVLDRPPPGIIKPSGIEPDRPSCGVRNVNGLSFSVTGAEDGESHYAEFPWMVAVMISTPMDNSDSSLNVYQCGASVIAPNVVLTAAHCVFNKPKKQLLLRAGEWDTQTRHEIYLHQDRRVAEVILHEAFDNESLANDVALLTLVEPFVLGENVQPICLPPRETSFDYQNCFASGWGKDQFGKEGKYQVILKKVELPVVPHATCQETMRSQRVGNRFVLDQSFLCAGGVAEQDMCRGDGGSPLVCPIPGSPTQYYQAGIVAWGLGCGEDGIPGVYGNVAFFRDWIDQQLMENSILARDYYTFKAH
ncbi:phenoloxidase-activating factor 2-like [Anopheles merus]|uniref:Phenoloxidase-activating factor 2 n=1 Tax=Anopheles merus TaxID=30066 RepID=A0A2C9H5W7_ANOME|nr:phenoloxidase-activating factor 2-like [Anopheles merus]